MLQTLGEDTLVDLFQYSVSCAFGAYLMADYRGSKEFAKTTDVILSLLFLSHSQVAEREMHAQKLVNCILVWFYYYLVQGDCDQARIR